MNKSYTAGLGFSLSLELRISYRPPGFAALANGRENTLFAPGKAAAGKYVHITLICGKYA
jgi:hypothetical protein